MYCIRFLSAVDHVIVCKHQRNLEKRKRDVESFYPPEGGVLDFSLNHLPHPKQNFKDLSLVCPRLLFPSLFDEF